MRLNNGKIFDYSSAGVLTDLSKCTYFFESNEDKNYLKTHFKKKEILSFLISEEKNKVDIIIKIPIEFECYHYYKGKITQKNISTQNSHFTYHGSKKGKKLSGESHLVIDDKNVIDSGRANLLEAPLAQSDDILKFPLPLCRFELSENIQQVYLNKEIKNYFELLGDKYFFNTLDIYIAKKGFLKNVLNGSSKSPNIVLSLFAYTNLEGFRVGKIVRRRDRFPQVLVLQSHNFELIIICIEESQNKFYPYNRFYYFHSRNYLKVIFDRSAKSNEAGHFIDLLNSYPPKGNEYFNILDII